MLFCLNCIIKSIWRYEIFWVCAPTWSLWTFFSVYACSYFSTLLIFLLVSSLAVALGIGNMSARVTEPQLPACVCALNERCNALALMRTAAVARNSFCTLAWFYINWRLSLHCSGLILDKEKRSFRRRTDLSSTCCVYTFRSKRLKKALCHALVW